ncbi:hypothetical protein GCM10010245_30850 [Streptomyces spectabilis]|nr:hypothetical protein GCM10010245_30850 [Streptomyces spectabilis]
MSGTDMGGYLEGNSAGTDPKASLTGRPRGPVRTAEDNRGRKGGRRGRSEQRGRQQRRHLSRRTSATHRTDGSAPKNPRGTPEERPGRGRPAMVPEGAPEVSLKIDGGSWTGPRQGSGGTLKEPGGSRKSGAGMPCERRHSWSGQTGGTS